MTKQEVEQIIKVARDKGERPKLCHADLRGAKLCHADLRGADLRHADLRDADLRDAEVRGANLRGANLRGAKLCHADLRGANLDYASWPIQCTGLRAKLCKKNMALLAMVFCGQECEDEDVQEFQKLLRPLALQSYRANDC